MSYQAETYDAVADILEGVARRFSINHSEIARAVFAEKRLSIYNLSHVEALDRFFRRWHAHYGEPHMLKDEHEKLKKYCTGKD